MRRAWSSGAALATMAGSVFDSAYTVVALPCRPINCTGIATGRTTFLPRLRAVLPRLLTRSPMSPSFTPMALLAWPDAASRPAASLSCCCSLLTARERFLSLSRVIRAIRFVSAMAASFSRRSSSSPKARDAAAPSVRASDVSGRSYHDVLSLSLSGGGGGPVAVLLSSRSGGASISLRSSSSSTARGAAAAPSARASELSGRSYHDMRIRAASAAASTCAGARSSAPCTHSTFLTRTSVESKPLMRSGGACAHIPWSPCRCHLRGCW